MDANATLIHGNEENNKSSNGNGNGNGMCRQTTTRWTPTSEQIRILKDLYYNTGVRSPSAEQIQKISSKLRQFGKIEGKNVFYWFQNHKARERQKKRLITSSPSASPALLWRSHEDHPPPTSAMCPNYPFTSAPPGGPSFSPAGGIIHADGQFGNYGSLSMENGFWRGGYGYGYGYGYGGHNLGWTAGGVDPYYHHHHYTSTPYNFLDKNTLDEEEEEEDQEEEDQDQEDSRIMETLPLFPIHGEEVSGGFWKQEHNNNWYMMQGGADGGGGNMTCSRASLELTLNSYGCTNWSG